MRKLIQNRFMSVLGSGAAILSAVTSMAQAQTTVTIYPNLSPGRIPGTGLESPSMPLYTQNVLSGLRLGSPNFGGDQTQDPTAFNTIGSPIVNGEGRIEVGIDDITAYPFNVWRGKIYRTGPFAHELGTFLRTSAHVESSIPFTTSDVTFGVYDSQFQFDGVLGDSLRASTAEGVFWGADQVRGTPDDTVYTGNSLTTPGIELNELNIAGPGWIGYYPPDSFLTEQEYLRDNRAYFETFYNGKYEGRAYIGLRDTVSAVNFTASVPDSGPMILVSAAVLFGVVRFSQRQGA